MTLDYAKAREAMVEQQVRPWDVLDLRVLEALSTVPRDAFVPTAHRALAYVDLAIPLGHGEFMWKPVVEGRALQALAVRNVRVEHADAFAWDTDRRFDAICVGGAVDIVPARFLAWLRPGGRMFVVHGRAPAMQASLVHADVNGARTESLFETDLAYLAGAAPIPVFTF